MQPPKVDVTGRPVELRRVDLDTFFRPDSVAVVGASDRDGTPNASMSRKIRAWAEHHGAAVHYVNPNRATVDGFPCVPSITDVPGEIDVVAILTGDAVTMFEQVLEKKPRFAVIFAAGFAEVGHGGERLQSDLGSLVAASDTHLLGPNTNLNAFETYRDDLPARRLALITQSGHQGRPIFQAQQLGIAMAYWAPTGNEVDLEFADFAAWFADQSDVGAIAAYIEGFKAGRTLLLAADHAARRGVPIVCIKVGRTEAGRSMALSHTGHLTGRDDVIAAAFRQYGVTRVRGLDELQDVSAMLCRAAAPQGDGICIYAISGGTGAHMADLAAEAGLHLPALTAATQAALRQWIPDYLRVSNPVDNGGAPSADWRGRKILDAIVADPRVTAVICPITGALASMSKPLAQDLVDVAETTDKPICVIWGSPIAEAEPAYEILMSSSRVVTVRTFQNAVLAVKAWLDWHRFHRRYRSPFARPVLRRSSAAARLEGSFTEHTAKQVLASYGIPVTREEVTDSPTAAVRAAGRLGYPVVLKASGPEFAHKSRHGLVRLGLASAAAVRRAASELLETAPEVLVAEQVAIDGAVECVVGVTQDDLFGPVVMVGSGGVLVEVLRDVTFLVPPFDQRAARRAVAELRGAPLIPDIGALVDVIMRAQRLAVDHADQLAELDINPLLVRSKGLGAVALDALLATR